MRKLWRVLLALALAAGLSGAVGGAARALPGRADDDILTRLQAIPGMTAEEKTSTMAGYRWFWLTYRQPIDHRRPEKGWFEQRALLEHASAERPMVLYTSGYNTPTVMFRSEPMALVDGNQLSVEYRYFTPSRPEPTDWSKDTIWQAATDEHRLIAALKTIYQGKWISTGASKGGMTATYHKRFYPKDVDGTVAYVAPNDVVNREDSAYDRFFATVGTDPACRTHLESLQRELLVRRSEMLARMTGAAQRDGGTWTIIGGVDRAFENSVMDFEWAFWQYHLQAECADVPAATATSDVLYAYFDAISGALTYTDQGLAPFIPYYYQAGTQLGWPSPQFAHLRPLLRYERSYQPRTYVPSEVPMRFDPAAMAGIDRWVRHHADHMLFVYGQNDPWGAEPFRLGPGSRDSAVYVAPGMNHSGRLIARLTDADRASATAALLRWAGVSPRLTVAPRVMVGEDPMLVRRPPL